MHHTVDTAAGLVVEASVPGLRQPHCRYRIVLAAAAKVFARRGYYGASTQDIAEVLGVRQASIYYYFDSKVAALEAVCADGLADFGARALAILNGPGTAPEKVARPVFQHLSLFRQFAALDAT
jgi:AcrR family transcriptional regulator